MLKRPALTIHQSPSPLGSLSSKIFFKTLIFLLRFSICVHNSLITCSCRSIDCWGSVSFKSWACLNTLFRTFAFAEGSRWIWAVNGISSSSFPFLSLADDLRVGNKKFFLGGGQNHCFVGALTGSWRRMCEPFVVLRMCFWLPLESRWRASHNPPTHG